DLPRGDRDRKVPRRDDADDADRHAHRHLELVLELRRGRLAEQPAPPPAHVEAHVDRFLDVAAGLGLHLPHLVRHEVGELALVVGHELREAEEDLAALGRRDEAPVLVRGLRGRDRAAERRDGGKTPMSGPWAGLVAWTVWPEAASIHSPPM